MAKMPGIPFDQGSEAQGSLSPTAVILHRTYGSWAGDYSVGVGTGRPGIGFHFLVGKQPGNWVQFYDTRTKCSHAAGANSWSVGIEFEGKNEQPLTDWQIDAGGQIVRWLAGDVGIPLDAFYHGARKGQSREFRGHSTVADSDHTDYITRSDFDKMVAGAVPELDEEGDNMQMIPEYADGAVHFFYVARPSTEGGTLWHAWWPRTGPAFGMHSERLGEGDDHDVYDGIPSVCVDKTDNKIHVVCDRTGSNPPAHWFKTPDTRWSAD
jgi:hypothetical protein